MEGEGRNLNSKGKEIGAIVYIFLQIVKECVHPHSILFFLEIAKECTHPHISCVL